VGQIGQNIQESVRPITDAVGNTMGNLNTGISSATQNVKTAVGNTLGEFSAKGAINAGTDFLNSNSIIAKFAFLILVLILFVFIFNLGIKLMGEITKPSSSPYIIKGLIPASKGIIVPQDPANTSSITVQRSNNNKSGAEFTWSVWLFVLDGGNVATTYSHVFNKGDTAWKTSGLATVNNAPGLYLVKDTTKNEMGLHIVMDTQDTAGSASSPQTIDITEIPLQKWFNVCIRLQNVILDVYVNGTNSGRIILPAVPRQNYNDINICQNGGFNGNLSNLRYFDHALSVFEINSLIYTGPNLVTSVASSTTGTTMANGTNYMSKMWYFGKM
jgi:hypothetical protein